jgi:hypothetical protein
VIHQTLDQEFNQLQEHRHLQRQLLTQIEVQRQVVGCFTQLLSADCRGALTSCTFGWRWVDDWGGLLILHYRDRPAIAQQWTLLKEFLSVQRRLTSVCFVVITGGTFPLLCEWDGDCWQCKVQAQSQST